MDYDLQSMSLDDLKMLQKNVDIAIRDFEKRKKKEALIAAQKVAQEHGFSLDEIFASKSGGTKGVPRYANPENPDQTWTGRGRQPQWVKDALNSGKSLDDLAV